MGENASVEVDGLRFAIPWKKSDDNVANYWNFLSYVVNFMAQLKMQTDGKLMAYTSVPRELVLSSPNNNTPLNRYGAAGVRRHLEVGHKAHWSWKDEIIKIWITVNNSGTFWMGFFNTEEAENLVFADL